MTLRHLRIFVAVAQTENMTQAAQNLYLSQPTVSQAVRELEEHYDLLLFKRLSRRLYITPAGENLLAYARPLLHQFDFLEQKMRQESQVVHLHIGATITIATCLMPTLVAQLEEALPQVDLFVQTANTQDIEERLLSGQLDMAVIEGEVTSRDLQCIPFAEDFLVLAFSSHHALAAKERITLADLEEQDFVIREPGSGTRELFKESVGHRDFEPHIKIEAHYPQAILNALTENHCVSVLSIRLLEQALAAGQVAVAKSPGRQWNRTFKLVHHKDQPLTPAMELFLDLLAPFETPFLSQDEISRSLVL